MAKPSKILRKAIKRLRASGLTWQEVADHFDGSRALAYMIATGQWEPNEQRAREILDVLPGRLFWKSKADLDCLVLGLLEDRGRMTGWELGRWCGTTDRTIRNSIRRLREDGYNISASMKPPRGYRLESR